MWLLFNDIWFQVVSCSTILSATWQKEVASSPSIDNTPPYSYQHPKWYPSIYGIPFGTQTWKIDENWRIVFLNNVHVCLQDGPSAPNCCIAKWPVPKDPSNGPCYWNGLSHPHHPWVWSRCLHAWSWEQSPSLGSCLIQLFRHVSTVFLLKSGSCRWSKKPNNRCTFYNRILIIYILCI